MTDILIRSAETFVQGAADDCVQANVESEANAGMRPMIVRSSDGNCCAWCSELAGEYYADEAPDDIYARHDNCTCTVTHVSERGAQDAHTKSWIDKEEENARRERIDGDQKYINDLRIQRMRERAARVGDAETFKEQEALKLVQSRTTDDIIGYKRLDGAVVRYRKSSNDLVIGYPPDGIATMYKPKNNPRRGYRYVIDKMKKKAIIHD